MFPALVIMVCMLELLFPHLYEVAAVNAYYSLWQFEMILLCAAAVFAENTQRDKSVLTVLLLWQAWLLGSDGFVDYTNPIYGSYEAALFTFFVLWALVRPYAYPSDERVERNVCIAFYRGTHAPLLSSLGALVGLPFASVAIVTGNTALRAAGCGKMVISDARALMSKDDYICIDTGIEGTPDVINAIHECVGKSTLSFGTLRTRCIANLAPVLKVIGYEPRTIFHKIPSIFYFQCVGQSHGR